MDKEILIIDDQVGIRMLLEKIFVSSGYHVCTLESGVDALHYLKEQVVDLILLDYHLPVMNGSEIIEQMEHANYQIPIILMSGFTTGLEERYAEHTNVKDVFGKPFDVKTLINRVEKILT